MNWRQEKLHDEHASPMSVRRDLQAMSGPESVAMTSLRNANVLGKKQIETPCDTQCPDRSAADARPTKTLDLEDLQHKIPPVKAGVASRG